MRVLNDGRVRRSAAEWQEVITRFDASGLSALAFCQRERLSRAAFTRWRRQLDGQAEQPAAFVELPQEVSNRSGELARGELELVLPGGVLLRWRP